MDYLTGTSWDIVTKLFTIVFKSENIQNPSFHQCTNPATSLPRVLLYACPLVLPATDFPASMANIFFPFFFSLPFSLLDSLICNIVTERLSLRLNLFYFFKKLELSY